MPKPFSLPSSFTYRMHALHKITDRVSEQLYARELKLSVAQARCLSVIGAFRPLSVKSLAQYANLDKAQASRAAQSLVEAGFVGKRKDSEDARGLVLELTTPGRKLCDHMFKLVEQRNNDIVSCLSKQEQAQLHLLMDRLLEAAKA